LLDFFVAIRGQRLSGGSCQGLNPQIAAIRPWQNPCVMEDKNYFFLKDFANNFLLTLILKPIIPAVGFLSNLVQIKSRVI